MAPPGADSPRPPQRIRPGRTAAPVRGRVESPVHFAEREASSLAVRLGRQPGAALGSPALDDRAARPGLHPGTKTVLTLAPPVIWLEGSLGHRCSPNLSHCRPAPGRHQSRSRIFGGLSGCRRSIAASRLSTSRAPLGVAKEFSTWPLTPCRARCVGYLSALYLEQRARDGGTSPGTFPVELHLSRWSVLVVHTCGYPC